MVGAGAVDTRDDRWDISEQGGEPGRQREQPDRVEVGAGCAQQRESIGSRLRQGALMGEHVARAGALRELERSDHTLRGALSSAGFRP